MKKHVINATLLITILLLCVQLFRLWYSPIELPEVIFKTKRTLVAYRRAYPRPLLFYRAVSEKNLFSPARSGTTGYSIVKRSGPAAEQRPPSMTLLGTVLIGKGRIAIIDVKKPKKRPGSYKIDEIIDGYVLKSIGKDKIILEKNGAAFELTLRKNGVRGAGGAQRTYPVSYSENMKRPALANNNTGRVRAVPLPPPSPPRPIHHIGFNTLRK